MRDAIAFLQLLRHPADAIALERVINVPPRAIGARTLGALRAASEARCGLSCGRLRVAVKAPRK